MTKEVIAKIGYHIGMLDSVLRKVISLSAQYMPPDGQDQMAKIVRAWDDALEEMAKEAS